MGEEVKVTTGKKVEPEEVEKQDPATIGYSITGTPQQAEVEGQAWYWRHVQCPWCGAIVRIWYDTELYHSYRCANCGGVFRA